MLYKTESAPFRRSMTVAVPGPVQASLAQLAGAQLGSRVTLPRRDGYYYDYDDDCYYDYNVYMDIWIYGYIYIYTYTYIYMYVCIQYFPQLFSVEFFLREAQGRPRDWDGCTWSERAQDPQSHGKDRQ